MFFPVDNYSRDLLVEEDEDECQDGGQDGDNREPPVRDVTRVHHPTTCRVGSLKLVGYVQFGCVQPDTIVNDGEDEHRNEHGEVTNHSTNLD